VAEALTELRDLAHGIYPPQLAHGGLAEALDAATKRAPTPAAVHATDLRRHPPHVELSVYFCCLEALQNASKHADGATAITISLAQDDALRFEVRDDGAGFDANGSPPGAGVTNMRDRLAAVGGRLTITSAPGEGAVVNGVVPLG
jgi:signal transduction histidine kinase